MNVYTTPHLSLIYDHSYIRGRGVDTYWDGHHDGGVVGRGGQLPLNENALRWVGVFE